MGESILPALPTKAPGLVLGVDPGLTGALALLDPSKCTDTALYGKIIGIWDVPTIKNPSKPKPKARTSRRIDAPALSAILACHAKHISFAIVEDSQVMTGKEGRVGLFNYARASGVLEGIIAGLGIHIYPAKPAVWKPYLGLTANKKDSLYLARKYYPEAEHFRRVKDHNRAEALLLAVCAIKVMMGL
jgi:crossover junction endodeoxyribonuclease RuvC